MVQKNYSNESYLIHISPEFETHDWHTFFPVNFALCFLWLSLPGHYRVADEALLAETT